MSVLAVRLDEANKKETVANLTLQDRCDRCPAAAQVVVVLKTTDMSTDAGDTLIFCNHHSNKYEVALAAKGASFYRQEIK